MPGKKAYPANFQSRNMLSYARRLFVLISFMILFSPVSNAQDGPGYDEILIFMDIPRIGGFDMPAVIHNDELFLPVKDFFDLLKIKNVVSEELKSVTGFFIDPNAGYLISQTEGIIKFHDNTFKIEPGDLIKTETDLFLKSDYYGKVFGLNCNFDFRSLSVRVNSDKDLPLIIEMRRQQMRENLKRLKGDVTADTSIKRTYPLFRFGMADWAVYSSQNIGGKSEARLNLALGSMIAGGEATVQVNYNSLMPFREKDQYYLWRYVDNDFRMLRQVMAGKINTQATSTLFSPVVGVQVTNTPTTYRRSFGTYTLIDKTEPGWTVELYVNNVLVDYVVADASGFFRFEVPLVYGNSQIKLRFYGPWGEERVREQNIMVPFNFLPKNTFEYRISAGVVEDDITSRFSRASFGYGVSRRLTLGGGAEYLSSVTSTPFMPFVNGSMGLTNNLLVSGEYTHQIRSKGSLSWRLPSNIILELYYTKYNKDQEAIKFNYLEEKRAAIGLPLRLGQFNSYNRFTLAQVLHPFSEYTTGEWLFSGSFAGISTNITTYSIFADEIKPNVYSSMALAIMAPANIMVRPQIQYHYTYKSLMSARLGLEKHIREKAYINFSVEKNFRSNIWLGEIGVRYNFRFAQTGLSVRQTADKTTMIEYARGSIINDRYTRYLGTDNQANVGRGAISVIPFLDINANGLRDIGEPRVYGLNLRAGGGRIEKNERDTTIRILGLEPYTNCLIEIDPNSFENISWRLPVRTLSVAVDPDIMKHIEIPVVVVGEVSGNVSLENQHEKKGIGRIIINVFTKSGSHIGTTLSEDDGYYHWLGLNPGDYFARPDTSQLNKLGMESDPLTREFSITAGIDGDYVDGLDFRLRMIESDTVVPEIKKPEPITRKDTSIMVVHEVVEELVTISKDSWAIQLGAFKNRTNADNLRKNLEKLLGRKVDIVIADGYFKVRINEIEDRNVVDQIVEVLRENGISELWIISQKARQQQVVLREVKDTIIKVVETRVEEPEMFESKIFIPFGEEFYKLDSRNAPIVDQTMMDRMKSHSTLDKVKFRDIRPNVRIVRRDSVELFIPGVKGNELASTGTVIPVRDQINIDKIVLPFSAPALSGKIEKSVSATTAPVAVKVPVISLQVAIFYKKSEALKARKKIMSKLNLPVKVVEQWEYFRVIITGFHSREETYQYYPELAGLGYPGPTLIEE